MADVKCPLCGAIYKGLNLDETEGWFICQKTGQDVLLPEYAKTCKVPLYDFESMKKKTRRENV